MEIKQQQYGLLRELALPWLLLTRGWPPRSLTPTLNQGTVAGPKDDLFQQQGTDEQPIQTELQLLGALPLYDRSARRFPIFRGQPSRWKGLAHSTP